jgi:hypothetical protein
MGEAQSIGTKQTIIVQRHDNRNSRRSEIPQNPGRKKRIQIVDMNHIGPIFPHNGARIASAASGINPAQESAYFAKRQTGDLRTAAAQETNLWPPSSNKRATDSTMASSPLKIP